MNKVLNILMFLLIISFIIFIFKYYSSIKNIKSTENNRLNIDVILKDKISNLPILADDTNNVVQFNNSFDSDFEEDKKRSFWDLLKIK
tara:strand:- start:4869 stop:5132 length:264 start_codon:yes stop_codon:yes gene_type:complete